MKFNATIHNNLQLGIRGVLLVFSIVTLGLVARFSDWVGNFNRINFSVFAAAFSVLFPGFIAIPLLVWKNDILADALYAMVFLVIDFLNWVFLLTAAAITADIIGSVDCGDYGGPNYGDNSEACHVAKASCAFFWFTFAIAWVLLFMSGYSVYANSYTLRNRSRFPDVEGYPDRKATAGVAPVAEPVAGPVTGPVATPAAGPAAAPTAGETVVDTGVPAAEPVAEPVVHPVQISDAQAERAHV